MTIAIKARVEFLHDVGYLFVDVSVEMVGLRSLSLRHGRALYVDSLELLLELLDVPGWAAPPVFSHVLLCGVGPTLIENTSVAPGSRLADIMHLQLKFLACLLMILW